MQTKRIMENSDNSYMEKKKTTRKGKLRLFLGIVIAIILIIIVLFFYKLLNNNTISLFVDEEIGKTPTQIIDVKEIGQWEFLSIEDEEMVDTIRQGIFSDDHLVRIYYGTLRLGVDMANVKDDWIKVDGKKISVFLPKVDLLDDRFIDEARTKAFFESGSWSDEDRQELYDKAYEKMINRCLNKENLKTAEKNATRGFYQMLKALGFEEINIKFEETH